MEMQGGGAKTIWRNETSRRHLEDQFFFLNTFLKSGQNSKTSQLDPDWGQSYVDQFFVVAWFSVDDWHANKYNNAQIRLSSKYVGST